MSNQTIYGVPRELLERASRELLDWEAADEFATVKRTHDELRALLDAPEVLVVPLTGPKEWINSLKPAVQPQGEPVAEIVSKFGDPEAFGERELIALKDISRLPYGTKLYAEQPAPAAVVLPERSPKDYAIEHAGYMATSADYVLAMFQAYALALMAADEGGDDGEGELFEAIDSTRQDLQEALVELRSMVFEFRKRRARIDATGTESEA